MAELTPSTREAARRLGVSDTTMHKAERTGRITREPDGRVVGAEDFWLIVNTRRVKMSQKSSVIQIANAVP
jgi:hypothetical protein